MYIKTILILLVPFILLSQEIVRSINIKSSSTIHIEANIVKFNIHLRCENEDPKAAFNAHKKLEKKLLQLLAKYKIPDSTIAYSLINFRKSTNREKNKYF